MDDLEALGRRAATGRLSEADGRWLLTEVLRLRRRLQVAEAVCWAKLSAQLHPGEETAAREAAAFHAWRTAPVP